MEKNPKLSGKIKWLRKGQRKQLFKSEKKNHPALFFLLLRNFLEVIATSDTSTSKRKKLKTNKTEKKRNDKTTNAVMLYSHSISASLKELHPLRRVFCFHTLCYTCIEAFATHSFIQLFIQQYQPLSRTKVVQSASLLLLLLLTPSFPSPVSRSWRRCAGARRQGSGS